MNGVTGQSSPSSSSDQAFDFASEVVKQQLNLAIGIFALTLTFLNDVVPEKTSTTLLEIAWVLYIASVFFGLLTLMALAGVLGSNGGGSIFSPNVKLFAGAQAIIFFLALALTLAFGICAL